MKKTLNELGVVVLFWNDSEKTIKCLKSLLNQQKQKFNIILVDNNSDQIFSKKVLDWLKKKKINSIKVKKKFYY
ncbi:glycosyltransferase [Pelagibacterales bacterium SAG-MED30]|nr:glycosyltransferase [Pelagibacterales bacterium SAG-MED30]